LGRDVETLQEEHNKGVILMKNRIQDLVTITIVAISIVFAVNTHSSAQEDGSPVSIGTYRTLHSQVLNEDRTLLVNLPRGYDETTIHYPVLYILYGGQVQGYFAEAVHIVDRLHEAGLIPQLILVGVKNVDRYRDNLPVNRGGERGGAENFLRFFVDELIPFVDESYRTKDFRILLGPQAGASFGLYTLMEQPGLFRVNITTNPFWNLSVREYLLERAKDFFSREGSMKSFLFITCNTSDDNEATMEYLHRLEAVVEKGKRSGFTMVLNPVGAREPEDLIPSPGLREGLETYFRKYNLPKDIEIDGIESLKAYYQALSEAYGYEVDIPEFTLIRQGEILEGSQKFEEANMIYEYVVNQYPHNLNSYNRLAELHRRLGNYDQAIMYYEQFLERRREPFIERRLSSIRRYVSESAAYAVEGAIRDLGIEAGLTEYEEIRSDDRRQLYIDENEFNALGYSFIAKGMIDAAVEVFKMNVELNPQSANVYDSLGEAYMLNDNGALAIENYRKSLELNPDNANARERLDKLEASGN
jgi:predicted alpha/beta superfamily hydrolase